MDPRGERVVVASAYPALSPVGYKVGMLQISYDNYMNRKRCFRNTMTNAKYYIFSMLVSWRLKIPHLPVNT